MANDKSFKIKNGLSSPQYLQSTGTSSSQAEPNYIGNPSYDSKSFSASSQTSAIQGITFKTDGTVMYILSSSDDRVYQYTLSTAWDISTASYASIFYSFSGLGITPTAIELKPDGTKMYISGTNGTIYGYNLSTAWNVSTASADTNLSPSEVTNIAGFAFKSDGTKLYIQIQGVFYQYTVGTAWNVSTASYDSVTKDFRTIVESDITDLILSSDGFSMSSASNSLESIEQFKMSTAYDLSTASYEGSYPITETAGVTSVTFGSSGTKMYVVATSETIYQYTVGTTVETLDLSTGSYLSKTLSANTTFAITNPPASGTAMGFVLSVTGGAVGYDLGVAVYDSVSFSVSSQETSPAFVLFKTDGTKMYVGGSGNDTVYQYSLSTAWDTSTASYDSVSFSVASQENNLRGLYIKPDGTKFYTIGIQADVVHQYSMSTAWDMSTASYDSVSFSVSSQENEAQGISFKSDGTKMYIVGSLGDEVNEFSLSTAWDVSTASFTTNFSISSQDTNPNDIYFQPDGTKFWISGDTNNTVFQYSCSTAWDISTASYDSVSFSVATQETGPQGITFGQSGTKLYVVGTVNDTVYQYTTGTALTLAWPNNVKWPSGTEPDAPDIGDKNIYTFVTTDGGTTYYGQLAGSGMA